jgi:hypothetical protein
MILIFSGSTTMTGVFKAISIGVAGRHNLLARQVVHVCKGLPRLRLANGLFTIVAASFFRDRKFGTLLREQRVIYLPYIPRKLYRDVVRLRQLPERATIGKPEFQNDGHLQR